MSIGAGLFVIGISFTIGLPPGGGPSLLFDGSSSCIDEISPRILVSGAAGGSGGNDGPGL